MHHEFVAGASKPAQAVCEGLGRVNVALRESRGFAVSQEMRDDTQHLKRELKESINTNGKEMEVLWKENAQ